MPNFSATLLILTVVLVLLPPEAYAFGAGDIPDFAYLNDKAFRHGDIENILETLVKSVGHASGGGLLDFAQSILSQAAGGAKFSKSDIKKVYFGNWLRDYSQAMDIAGLSKLTADTLVLVVSVLGFMTFGFCTEEFEVTADRLGVYLPVEHIDNPKGYAEKEGDARQYHPKLRPPVDPRELEIDERTGMKNYMATENQGWDTSTAHIRRVFRECIEIGRRAGGQGGADLWEAYRLLGTGLHTLEDLLAHSNWCEIALRKMGHSEVFCHVGDNVVINTPNGRAPPIVTGTFGGADFLHSLMGEATDKLSQASVTDLSQKISSASQDDNAKADALRSILKQLPIGGGSEKVDEGESMHEKAKAYQFDPNNVAPPDVQRQLIDLLKWRDSVYRDVLKKIEMVPGLTDLIEELTNALNAYVYTILAPYLGPILQQATGVLGEGSKAVIDSDDQYAVFNDPNASDPSHSLLSKDHFTLILNEPAGKIAQVVVEHSVNLIVKAWGDNSNPDDVINVILEAFHHPYYANGQSRVQHQMFETMEQWFGALGPDMSQQVIQALTKESVRAGKNKRIGSETQDVVEPGYSHESYGSQAGNYQKSNQSQYGQQQSYGGTSAYGSGGGKHDNSDRTQGYGGSRRSDDTSYSSKSNEYGTESRRPQESRAYGSSHRQDYDRGNDYGSSRRQEHGGSEDRSSHRQQYGSSDNKHGISGREEYGSGNEYGSSRLQEYGGGDNERESSRRQAYSGGNNDYTSSRRQEYSGDNTDYRSSDRQSQVGGDNEYGSSHRQEYGSSRLEDSGFRRKEDHHGYRQREQPGDSGYTNESSRGSGYSGDGQYGSRHQEVSGYGGSYGESRSDTYSSQESSGYQPSYNREATTESSGYGSGYGQEQHQPARHGRHGDERGSGNGGYGSGGYAQESSGYNPAYTRQEDDTFGAERLNIRDSNDDSRSGYSANDIYENNY